MNENFSDLRLSAGLANSDMRNIEITKANLEGFKNSFNSFWNSATGDKLMEAVEFQKVTLDKVYANLSRLKQVIELINTHNTKREIRETKKEEIAALEPKLYKTETYTTTFLGGDGLTHTETHTREVLDTAVQAKIETLEEEIKEINEYLDELVEQIKAITGA